MKKPTHRIANKLSPVAFLCVSVALLFGVSSAYAQQLEEIVVTATKREIGLQSTSVAISAYSGENLARDRIFTVNDLASSVPALSLLSPTPVDLEINIRGITNTRLDSPSAEPAVGTFVDEVYIGRNGGLNSDFYDIERIEVIRGPQGVLLGKSVVGGALSIITRQPEFETSGAVTIARGNYDSQLLSGHVTGELKDGWAGRLSMQSRSHDGYAYDILHDRELNNLDSFQVRGQLLHQPDGGKLRARVIVDYTKDSTNGINVVAVSDGLSGGFRPRPWSQLREFLGLTDPRVSIPEETKYVSESTPSNQQLIRESMGLTLNVQRDFDSFLLSSITGYREGRSESLYDQTGGGPDVLDDTDTFGVTYADFFAFNPTAATFLFSEPVNEEADITAFSQEIRLTSTGEGPLDWLVGVYFKRDGIDKLDRFVGEGISGALPTLSGESHWFNQGENTNVAGFGQVGWRFTDHLKLNVGVRWTSDKKEGRVKGTAVRTGDRFNPGDTVPLTPLTAPYSTDYGETWTKATPQVTLEYSPSEDLFVYGTVSTGFKGGYFQDTANSAFAAAFPTRPEEVTNYEIGVKSDFAGGRMRLNAAVFFMDYTDLQVEQTNQDCLCNLVENASDAEIKGLEAELTIAASDRLLINISGSTLDTEYIDFVETSGVISSGNHLQRTPENQYSFGIDYTFPLGEWGDALNLYVNYSWQSKLYWQPSNDNTEDSYALVDARLRFSPDSAPWGVSLWGKNLADKLYRTNIIPFFGEEVSQYGPPKTFGLEFTYAFQ